MDSSGREHEDYLPGDVDEPHRVVVSDAENGVIYGANPDQAVPAMDAAVARDSGADVTATIARDATALP